MSTSEDANGILGHLEQHLGKVQKVESADSDNGNRGYDLAFYHSEEPPISTVVTNGLRFQSVGSMVAEELACTLWDGQERIAHYLADTIASMITRGGSGIEYGMVFKNDQPIIRETEIQAILAHPSPYFDDSFNLFPSSTEPSLQIVTLIPITMPEADFVRDEGTEMMFEVFQDNRVNLLDVTRPSAV